MLTPLAKNSNVIRQTKRCVVYQPPTSHPPLHIDTNLGSEFSGLKNYFKMTIRLKQDRYSSLRGMYCSTNNLTHQFYWLDRADHSPLFGQLRKELRSLSLPF